jgi:hypothetical protein
MGYEPVFTNKAMAVMRSQHISREEVLTAFHSNNLESVRIPGAVQGIATLRTSIVGCIYKKNQRGQYVIITCWKRNRP